MYIIRQRRHKYGGRNGHHSISRHGNARIFCPGIIKFVLNISFSVKLVSKCKLTANAQYNVAKLCKYNGKVCKDLGLNRLYKIFETLSTFLQTASTSNTLIPSPYHCNYIAKFVKKAVDELYLNNEIQGIAIIACLLRQSQYFALLFYKKNLNENVIVESTNCGYLLQSCVNQYLRVIKYRIDDKDINDVQQLEQFTFLLNKQKKQMLQLKDNDDNNY